MDSAVNIVLFILFLLEYAGYVFIQARLYKYIQEDPARMLSFRVGQLAILVAIAHVGFTLLIIGRVFSLALLALLLAAYEFGVLVAIVARALLGTNLVNAWIFGIEFGARHTVATTLGQMIPGVLMVVGYPIAMGIAYFSLDKGSDELLFWVIVLTAATVLIGVLWQLVLGISMLLSAYVKDELRTQTLISQLMAIPQPALWFAIAYWASAEGDQGVNRDDARGFSLALVALLVLIAAVAILPYLAGAYRARKKRKSLLERESRLWKHLAQTAEVPMRPSYASDLQAFDEDLGRERESFDEEHETFLSMLEMFRDVDAREDLADRGVRVPTGFDADLRELELSDPRTRFDAALRRVEAATAEMEVEANVGGEKRDLATAWVKAAQDRSAQAETAAAAADKSGSRAGALVGVVVTPVMGVVLDQFGVLIWNELSGLAA